MRRIRAGRSARESTATGRILLRRLRQNARTGSAISDGVLENADKAEPGIAPTPRRARPSPFGAEYRVLLRSWSGPARPSTSSETVAGRRQRHREVRPASSAWEAVANRAWRQIAQCRAARIFAARNATNRSRDDGRED